MGATILTACTREVAAPTTTTLAPPPGVTTGSSAVTTTTTTGVVDDATTVETTVATASTTVVTTADTTASTTPDTELPTEPVVGTDVVGTAVGGSAGELGQDGTNIFSELIRSSDGTCSGWAGPGGSWTQGVESGAPVIFLDRDTGEPIGDGQLGTSAWADVDPGDREQWNCTFPFTGTIDGAPESFSMKVADLEPWVVRSDPTNPGAVVASVDTVASFNVFPECAEAPTVDSVPGWTAVREFWSIGIPSLCSAGLPVVDIERPCRPEGFASDYIVEVTTAAEPRVVIENSEGLQVDPEVLIPGTAVVVHVAVGRPC